ncbi:MAG: hypothetical protein QOH24_1625 [Verrucomicrobiota bacterium]
MEKVTEYIMAIAEPNQFTQEVNKHISGGYQPHGSAFVLEIGGGMINICQPMVKKVWDRLGA